MTGLLKYLADLGIGPPPPDGIWNAFTINYASLQSVVRFSHHHVFFSRLSYFVTELELTTFGPRRLCVNHQAIFAPVILNSVVFARGEGRIIFDELGGEGGSKCTRGAERRIEKVVRCHGDRIHRASQCIARVGSRWQDCAFPWKEIQFPCTNRSARQRDLAVMCNHYLRSVVHNTHRHQIYGPLKGLLKALP